MTCDKFASLTHDFVGAIEKIYENSAVVEILEHHKDDTVVVSDFHNRAVVALDHMKKREIPAVPLYLINIHSNIHLYSKKRASPVYTPASKSIFGLGRRCFLFKLRKLDDRRKVTCGSVKIFTYFAWQCPMNINKL